MLDFFNQQHICPVWWTSVSTNDWYSNGYKLCSAVGELFLHAYEADFFQELLKNKDIKLVHTTTTQKYVSYLDHHLEISNGGRLKTNLYDKRYDFTFPIVNFPFFRNNIPASPAHGLYISQLIRYSKACAQYRIFMDRAQVLTQKLLKQDRLLIDRSHRYKHSTVVITIWLTVTKYPYLKGQRIFSLLSNFFLSFITDKTFIGLDYIYE